MKKLNLAVALVGALLLAGCRPQDTKPTNPTPQPEAGFTWVKEPLQLWQQQNLYSFNLWADRERVELAAYTRQSYVNGNQFAVAQYSLTGHGSTTWQEDPTTSLVFDIRQNNWAEVGSNFTATEGPVGTAGVKTVHVIDAIGSKYYSLERRDLSGQPIINGITEGFGDGRDFPEVIQNGSAKFSQGAEAYTWIVDQKDPIYAIDRMHYIFTSRYETYPVKTCEDISPYCSSTADTLSEAIDQKAWILNSGENLSIRLQGNGQAEVRFNDPENSDKSAVFTIKYTYTKASNGSPERIVFDEIKDNDSLINSKIAKMISLGDSRLAFYAYDGQVVRGTYSPARDGIKSKSFQYNKQAINDIMTKWYPVAAPVLE